MSASDNSSADAFAVTAGFDAWRVGRCRYKCNTCGGDRLFAHSAVFWQHVREDHGQTAAAHKRDNPGYMVASEQIRCQICLEFVLHDFGKMSLHLSKVHGEEEVTLEDYYKTYVEKTGITREVKEEDMEVVPGEEEEEGAEAVKEEIVAEEEEGEVQSLAEIENFEPLIEIVEGKIEQVEEDVVVDFGEEDWVFECPDLEDANVLRQTPCKMCGLDFSSMTLEALHHHIRSAHRLNAIQYYYCFFKPSAWLECCLYKCLLCNDFSSMERYSFAAHLWKAHETGTPNFVKKFGSCIYGRSMHECVICGNAVTHSAHSILQHVGRCHSLKTDKYFKKMLAKYAGKEAAVVRSSTMTMEKMVTKAMKRVLKRSMKVQKKKKSAKVMRKSKRIGKETQTVPFPCKISKKKNDGMVSSTKPKQKRNRADLGGKETWYNGFVFKCDRCEKQYFGCDSIRKHLKKAHGTVINQDLHLVRKANLECKVCGKVVPRVRAALRAHMRKHSLTLEDYEVRFSGLVSGGQVESKEICRLCRQSFFGMEELGEHLKANHDLDRYGYFQMYKPE